MKVAAFAGAITMALLVKSWAQPVLVIRASTQSKPDTPAIQSLLHFKSRAEAASQGAIKVKIFDSARLYSDAQVGPAVASGAVEMGVINLSRFAVTIPVADVFQLPFLFNSVDLERKATARGSEIRALIEKTILTHEGVRTLWWQSQGQTVFLSNGFSVANPDNIANKVVRTFGPTITEVVHDCGGMPKDIGGSQQESALENHTVDVGMAGISSVVGRKLWEHMDTITRTNHASVQFVIAINEKFWQTIPQEQRSILLEAAGEADEVARKITDDIEAKSYRQLSEEGRVRVVELSQEELTLWRICSTDVLLQFLERSGPAGLEMMRAYGRMRQ